MFTINDIFLEDIYTQVNTNTISIIRLNNYLQILIYCVVFSVIFVLLLLLNIVYEMNIMKYKLKSKINKLKLNV